MRAGDFRPTRLLSDSSLNARIRRDHSSRAMHAVEETVLRAIPDDAIHETVLRYQLQQHAVAQLPLTQYYLAVRGRDPSEDLLHRVRGLVSQVQPLSQCRVSVQDRVTDRNTGAQGLIVEVSSLRWLQMTAAEVVGGYYAAPWQAAVIRYCVEYDGGDWAVTRTRILWRA